MFWLSIYMRYIYLGVCTPQTRTPVYIYICMCKYNTCNPYAAPNTHTHKPTTQELFKYLALRFCTLSGGEPRSPRAILIYLVAAAAGFACCENVRINKLYVIYGCVYRIHLYMYEDVHTHTHPKHAHIYATFTQNPTDRLRLRRALHRRDEQGRHVHVFRGTTGESIIHYTCNRYISTSRLPFPVVIPVHHTSAQTATQPTTPTDPLKPPTIRCWPCGRSCPYTSSAPRCRPSSGSRPPAKTSP